MWRFFIADSSTLTHISEITYDSFDKAIQLQLNRPGTLSFRMHITNEKIREVEPFANCVIAYKNNVPVWSGPIFVIQEAAPSNYVNVTANGWFELLNRRLLKTQLDNDIATTTAISQSYNNVDAGEIAWDLIRRTNYERDTGIIRGDITPTQNRTRTYNKYQVIGQEILALSSIESGFDMEITPIKREFNVYGGVISGTILGKGSVKPNVIFSYGRGPDNVTSISRQIDGTKLVNEEIVAGRYASSIAKDSTSIARYGLFQEYQQLSEVVNNDVLAAYAAVEVTFRAKPVELITFVPSANKNAPQIFKDYDLGDIVQISANYGRMIIPEDQNGTQAVRVFAVNISIDNNGVERLSEIQTTAAGL